MEMNKKRGVLFAAIAALLIAGIVGVLIWASLVSDANAGNVSAYTTVVGAARGEILDRNGVPLVTNRQGHSITFNAVSFPSSEEQDQRNDEIISLIQLCEANKVDYIHNLPIKLTKKGGYAFTKKKGDAAYIKWLKSPDMLDLNAYASAADCMKAMVKKFELQPYSKEDALKIAAVRAEMIRNTFNVTYPYTFAEDVPTELITIIMENKAFYRGVEDTVVAYREYPDGTLAPHILGRVAGITEETYKEETEKLDARLKKAKTSAETEDLERNAYTIHDDYGSFGLENSLESYLRGRNGEKSVTIDADGKTSEVYTVNPEQGNSVILTIDKELQAVAQASLKDRVDTLNVSSDRQCAAAVVVQNVNTGEILACATYPSYDNNKWAEDYSDWAQDDNAPLWNRAVNSTYEPGSTFKPCVAIAALETGTIDKKWTWTCNGAYTYYSDHTFWCAHHVAHGRNNVTGAINQSCNCFFYETGRQLGIAKIDEWANNFGFGQKTGVEIPEAVGVISSPEEREANGGIWYAGDTITTAIGESDNQFTLLQMCNYVATIANGGTRYVPHFVREIKSSDYDKTVLIKQPQIAQQLNIKQSNLDLVREGMLQVGTIGFCKKAFSGLPVQAAAKTGTSDVVKIIDGKQVEGNNGFLVTYAPYENPEIAIAVCVETADSGALTAVVAADIYEYYFSPKQLQTTQDYGELLG